MRRDERKQKDGKKKRRRKRKKEREIGTQSEFENFGL